MTRNIPIQREDDTKETDYTTESSKPQNEDFKTEYVQDDDDHNRIGHSGEPLCKIIMNEIIFSSHVSTPLKFFMETKQLCNTQIKIILVHMYSIITMSD